MDGSDVLFDLSSGSNTTVEQLSKQIISVYFSLFILIDKWNCYFGNFLDRNWSWMRKMRSYFPFGFVPNICVTFKRHIYGDDKWKTDLCSSRTPTQARTQTLTTSSRLETLHRATVDHHWSFERRAYFDVHERREMHFEEGEKSILWSIWIYLNEWMHILSLFAC